jgi:hypothetical protein
MLKLLVLQKDNTQLKKLSALLNAGEYWSSVEATCDIEKANKLLKNEHFDFFILDFEDDKSKNNFLKLNPTLTQKPLIITNDPSSTEDGTQNIQYLNIHRPN